MENRLITIPYSEKSIEACITIPESTCEAGYGVILTHGAGGDMHLPQLKILAEHLGAKGITVVRFTCKGLNLAYRVKVYTRVMEHVCAQYCDVKRYFLAGRSMGARAAVIVANNAKGTQLENNVAGVIALSYPIHTKDNKSNLRDGPLYALEKPVCFVSGTEDEMCEQTLFEDVLRKVDDHVIHWVSGADHALKIRRSKEECIVAEVADFIVDWCTCHVRGQTASTITDKTTDSCKIGTDLANLQAQRDFERGRSKLKRKTEEHVEDKCKKRKKNTIKQ